MTHVAILSPFMIDGDAVSNDVIGMYQALIRAGYEVQVFAAEWRISNPKIEDVNQIHLFIGSSDDILIYHYSLKWDVGLKLLQELQCIKIIKYHDITPPEFYEGINDDYFRVCTDGREQLQSIVDERCRLYLADSDYNQQELYSKGVEQNHCLVLTPFHQIARLQDEEVDLNVMDKYQDGKTNILMVGRLAPNKGYVALIDAFKIYYNNYNRESRLLIVGKEDERLIKYTTLLYEQVKSLGLEDAVVFTGGVSEQALKAYYLVSHVFMITSEHEGFCVPLVESMAMKLPIVAYGSSAIPYTVGKTGLVWEQPDPYLLAGSVDNIARNEFISANLGDMAWRRYKETFANEQIEARFMAAIKSLL